MVLTDIIEHRGLNRQLRGLLPGRGQLQLSRLGEGQSNPTYLIRRAGQEWVLRSKPPGPLLRSAHRIEREYRVMQCLHKGGFPVPQMVVLIEDGASATQRAYFVMERIAGRIFRDPVIPNVGRAERAQIYDAMNRLLARLHDVDPVSIGLERFGRPGNYCQRQTAVWTRQYAQSVDRPNPLMADLERWLSLNLPADADDQVIVHGDYRIDNMIFHPQEPMPSVLIDWELATLGDPLADLAYQCAQWRLPHASALPGLEGADRDLLMIPGEREYLERYCERRRIDLPNCWRFYLVFSLYRLAAILAGVDKRARDGNAASPDSARRYGQEVATVIQLAMDIAEGHPDPV